MTKCATIDNDLEIKALFRGHVRSFIGCLLISWCWQWHRHGECRKLNAYIFIMWRSQQMMRTTIDSANVVDNNDEGISVVVVALSFVE